MLRPLPLGVACFLTVVSAMTFALAFPPWSIRPLAFVALVPLFLALRSGGSGRAIALAWLWGIAMAWLNASVVPSSIARYYDRSPWFGFAIGNLVFTVMSVVYYMAFALIDRALIRRPRAWTPLLVAAAWVLVELARARLFTGTTFFIGNPWALLGYTHASGPLAQTASWAGVYGISFVLAATNSGLAGWMGAWGRPSERSAAQRGLALAVLPAIAATLHGQAMLRAAPTPGTGDDPVKVAIVQGNIAVGRHWRSDYYGKNLDVYLALTHRALREASPAVIVWPESAMNFFVEAEPRYQRAITDLLGDADAQLLAGGPSGSGDKLPPYFNSVFVIDSEGIRSQRYDKQYLIPFTEYYPFRRLDLMQRTIEGARTFERGRPDPPPLETRLGRAGILVCNEAMLPEVARARVRAGAEVLVSPSNDSWITGRAFSEHMLAVVGLRAIEQRRYLIRASTSGPSAIVDPWGRVIARAPSSTRDLIHGRVRPERTLTAYARLGDSFAALCSLAVAVALVRDWLRRRKARRSPGKAG